MSQSRTKIALAIVFGLSVVSSTALAGWKVKLGQDAEAQKFRFVAAIGLLGTSDEDVQFICTGSLVDAIHVVTAAHCLFDRYGLPIDADRLVVLAAHADLGKFDRTELLRVERAEPHPSYDPDAIKNDIAVMTLATTLPRKASELSNAIVSPLLDEAPPPGAFMEIAGFGVMDEGRELLRSTARDGTRLQAGHMRLQMARIPLVDLDTCQAALDRIPPDEGFAEFKVDELQLCAGFERQSADACQGDSGGPLIWRDKSGPPKLVGIVSYGIGCGRDGIYGIYTRVAGYSAWLRTVLNN